MIAAQSVLLFIVLGVIVVTTTKDSDAVNDIESYPSSLKNTTTTSAACPCSNINWCNTIQTPPRKEVFAFSVGGHDWKRYDWSKVTTIAMFGDYDADLMCFAHSQGVRVVLKGVFSEDTLYNKQAASQWMMDKVKMAVSQHMDGINLDIEFPVNETSAPVLTQFVQEATKVFHNSIPNSQVTFDVAWSPKCIAKCCKCIDGRCYDYKAIAEATDFVFVMSYDEQSQICGDCVAMANSPYDQTAKGVQGFLDLGIPADKLVLGVPWYGYDYPCVTLKDNVCSIKEVPFRGVNCSDAAGSQKEYRLIQNLLKGNSTMGGRQWSKIYKAPFFNFKDESGQSHQMWYDDQESLKDRLQNAKDAGLRGVGMWHADCLDYSNKTMVDQIWGTFDTFLH